MEWRKIRRNITAICVSEKPEPWLIPSVPYYNHTEGWKPFKRDKSKERVTYLAERRNSAAEGALKLHPNTEHIFMVDSYYLGQVEQLRRLLEEYDSCDGILGASTWIIDKTRIRTRVRFFDSWTTPEAANLTPSAVGGEREADNSPRNSLPTGWLSVRAVGACYLYPRHVWEQNRYGLPETDGCEHNFLCERSGLPVWLSFNTRLWRDPIVYSWPKRIRCSLHLGRFLP